MHHKSTITRKFSTAFLTRRPSVSCKAEGMTFIWNARVEFRKRAYIMVRTCSWGELSWQKRKLEKISGGRSPRFLSALSLAPSLVPPDPFLFSHWLLCSRYCRPPAYFCHARGTALHLRSAWRMRFAFVSSQFLLQWSTSSFTEQCFVFTFQLPNIRTSFSPLSSTVSNWTSPLDSTLECTVLS